MYIWRDTKLAEDLRYGGVSEREQVAYLIASTLLTALLMTSYFGHMAWSGSGDLGFYDYFSDVLMLTVTALLIILTYKINSSGDNRDYLIRYICLSFPITLKIVIFGFIFCTLGTLLDNGETIQKMAALEEQMSSNVISSQFYDTSMEQYKQSFQTGPMTVSALLLIYFYMFWRYTKSFKIAAGISKNV